MPLGPADVSPDPPLTDPTLIAVLGPALGSVFTDLEATDAATCGWRHKRLYGAPGSDRDPRVQTAMQTTPAKGATIGKRVGCDLRPSPSEGEDHRFESRVGRTTSSRSCACCGGSRTPTPIGQTRRGARRCQQMPGLDRSACKRRCKLRREGIEILRSANASEIALERT